MSSRFPRTDRTIFRTPWLFHSCRHIPSRRVSPPRRHAAEGPDVAVRVRRLDIPGMAAAAAFDHGTTETAS